MSTPLFTPKQLKVLNDIASEKLTLKALRAAEAVETNMDDEFEAFADVPVADPLVAFPLIKLLLKKLLATKKSYFCAPIDTDIGKLFKMTVLRMFFKQFSGKTADPYWQNLDTDAAFVYATAWTGIKKDSEGNYVLGRDEGININENPVDMSQKGFLFDLACELSASGAADSLREKIEDMDAERTKLDTERAKLDAERANLDAERAKLAAELLKLTGEII